MKQFYFLLLLLPVFVFAQETPAGKYTVDANYFYGNIIPHRKSIQHLITGHPDGVLLSFSQKTFGDKEWESAYGYPDFGLSFHYQDMINNTLGDMYGLYGHYSFYFFNRSLMFRLGQGVAYNTNPYDKETNFRNYAYGAHFMPSTYFLLNFTRQDLWHGLGFNAGLFFVHHSNASMIAPNTSTNTIAANVGLNYTFGKSAQNVYKPHVPDTINYKKMPVQFTIAVRGGVNESDIIGSGQYPYYAASFYATKRISRKSGFELGAEFFWPEYLKEFIHYQSVAFPELHVVGTTDYKKAGIFGGYELYINNFSLEGQVGYYVYSPYNSTGLLYERVGLKYYLSNRIFGSVGLKTHGAKAEVMECSIGVRL